MRAHEEAKLLNDIVMLCRDDEDEEYRSFEVDCSYATISLRDLHARVFYRDALVPKSLFSKRLKPTDDVIIKYTSTPPGCPQGSMCSWTLKYTFYDGDRPHFYDFVKYMDMLAHRKAGDAPFTVYGGLKRSKLEILRNLVWMGCPGEVAQETTFDSHRTIDRLTTAANPYTPIPQGFLSHVFTQGVIIVPEGGAELDENFELDYRFTLPSGSTGADFLKCVQAIPIGMRAYHQLVFEEGPDNKLVCTFDWVGT